MTVNDLTKPPLPLLVQGRPQVSFARDPSEGGRGLGGGGGGQITSKGDGLLRSNLPLGDSLLRGAGYFVTPPQAPGHCHQLGLAYGRETWVYLTNTLSATVAFLLLPDTNLLPH